jgi:uncharacterized membrane protein YgcG
VSKPLWRAHPRSKKMITRIQNYFRRKKARKALVRVAYALAKDFTRRRDYTEGQILRTCEKLGYGEDIKSFAIVVFSEEAIAKRYLEGYDSKRKFPEIWNELQYTFVAVSLAPERYDGSLVDLIQDACFSSSPGSSYSAVDSGSGGFDAVGGDAGGDGSD